MLIETSGSLAYKPRIYGVLTVAGISADVFDPQPLDLTEIPGYIIIVADMLSHVVHLGCSTERESERRSHLSCTSIQQPVR